MKTPLKNKAPQAFGRLDQLIANCEVNCDVR